MSTFFKFFFFFFFFFSLEAGAQESFPESWIGNYKGELHIFGVDSVKMKVAMNLEIDKTSNDSIFNWTLIYNFNGNEDKRPYKLKVVNKNTGHYKIDEMNSIVLDGYQHTNTFTSFFGLIDSFIIATYTKNKDVIVFEIISSKSEPVSTTGNTKFEGEDIPEVRSYLVNGRQKAFLTKIE